MKSSFNVINNFSNITTKISNAYQNSYNPYKLSTIINKIFIFLFIIVFLSFSKMSIAPENVFASIKKNKSIDRIKSNNSGSKSNHKNISKNNKSTSNNKKNTSKNNKNISKNNKNEAKNNKNISKNNKSEAKNNKNISKNNKNEAKNNKNMSEKKHIILKGDHNVSSEMFIYFLKITGKKIKNYNEYTSVVKKGETIIDMLKPYGLTHADIIEFSKNNKKIFNLQQIKAGKPYSIITSKLSKKNERYLIYEKESKKYIILPIYDSINENKSDAICYNNDNKNNDTNNNNDRDKENNTNKNANIRIKQVSGIIKSSLHKTAAKIGLNKKQINQLSSIFKNTSALSNLCKGDLIQIAYQEKYVNGTRVATGVITAAIITSKKKSYQAYRFTYNGKYGYYDETGNSLESSFLKAPLQYREISSGFSTRRFHPIKQIYQPHPGIDYAAPKGTPVKSVGDGIVVFKGYAESAGNYMKIKHPGTGMSEYMHLSGFNSSIKLNKKVSKGDVIGYVGSTGYATGPHLDLRFMVNNRYVDYRKLKLPHGNPLPKQFRNIFFQHVAMINKQWNRTARRELSLQSGHWFKVMRIG